MLMTRIFPTDAFPAHQFVVVFARRQGQWLFSRHRDRLTWETQGGHVEPGETPDEAAARELFEESGATGFTLRRLCDYWAGSRTGSGVGAVYLAEVTQLGELPPSEMAEVRAFDDLPSAVTYPDITPVLFRAACQALDNP